MELDSRQRGLLLEFCFRGAKVAADGSYYTTKTPKEIIKFAETELGLTYSKFANNKGGLPVLTEDNVKKIKGKDFREVARRVGLWDTPVDWNDLSKLQEYGIHNLSVLRDIPSQLSLIGIHLFTPTYRQLKWWQLILSYSPEMKALDVAWFASIYHYRELHAAMRDEIPDFKDIDLMISLQPWISEERLNKYLEIVLKEEKPSVFTMIEGMQAQQEHILATVHFKTIEMFISQASNGYQGTPWRLPSVAPSDFLLWQEAIEELRSKGDFELESFKMFPIQQVRNALRKTGLYKTPDNDINLVSSVDETAIDEELKKLYIEKGNEYEESLVVTRFGFSISYREERKEND